MWRGSFTLNFIGKSISRSFISFQFLFTGVQLLYNVVLVSAEVYT